MDSTAFVYDFAPGLIYFGRDVVSDLGELLRSKGCERAMVVSGRNVGLTPVIREPLVDSLGNRPGRDVDPQRHRGQEEQRNQESEPQLPGESHGDDPSQRGK